MEEENSNLSSKQEVVIDPEIENKIYGFIEGIYGLTREEAEPIVREFQDLITKDANELIASDDFKKLEKLWKQVLENTMPKSSILEKFGFALGEVKDDFHEIQHDEKLSKQDKVKKISKLFHSHLREKTKEYRSALKTASAPQNVVQAKLTLKMTKHLGNFYKQLQSKSMKKIKREKLSSSSDRSERRSLTSSRGDRKLGKKAGGKLHTWITQKLEKQKLEKSVESENVSSESEEDKSQDSKKDDPSSEESGAGFPGS